MGNRVLNTALLSLATVSVLSTNAFATINHEATSVVDSFTAKAGRLDVTKLDLKVNTVSKLNTITITVKDSNSSRELTPNIITSLKLFQRGLDSTDEIGSVSVSDVNSTGTTFTITPSKEVFFKTADDINPNSFYVSAMYGDFPSKELVPHNSEVNFTIVSINATENYYTDVVAKTRNESATQANVTIGKDFNFTIDRSQPYIDSNNSLTYEVYNLSNTNYKYSINKLEFNISEVMNTNLVTTASANSAFKITDSLEKVIPITSASLNNYQKTATAQLVLELNPTELNTSSGSLKMTYTGNILQDNFGNELDNNKDNNLTSRILVKDETAPRIAKFVLDFDDKSKGTITFSEVVAPKNWASVDIKNIDTNISVVASSIVAENKQDTEHSNSLRTVITFDLNKTAPKSNLSVTYNTNRDGNITDKATKVLANSDINHTAVLTNFDLVEGGKWNLISLDNETRTTSKHILKTGSVQMIWEYLGNNKWNAFPSSLVAGKGYWIKSALNETADQNFSKVEVGYQDTKTVKVDPAIFIKNATKNSWELLGTVEDITRSVAYSQVADGCYGVAIYDYNASAGAWNVDENISKNRGIWVKQDCSTNE
jgi:hypothetical protein